MNSIPDFVTGYCQRHELLDPLQDSDGKWWAYESQHDVMPAELPPLLWMQNELKFDSSAGS